MAYSGLKSLNNRINRNILQKHGLGKGNRVQHIKGKVRVRTGTASNLNNPNG